MNVIRIIGIGNIHRGDDGAGVVAAQRLRRRLAGIEVREAYGEAASLIEAWRDADTVYLIDATRSGAPPGTVFRFDAVAEPLPAPLFPLSTHTLGVGGAVELARALGLLPPRCIVYGIEGSSFEAGEGLSTDVAQAVETVVERIAAETDR